jgi:hypothetical protein
METSLNRPRIYAGEKELKQKMKSSTLPRYLCRGTRALLIQGKKSRLEIGSQ